ncbi:MAG: neutral/alkaline non-lysosomal ceramidase N-terminal domain-containing protein [Pirellulales bacterium]|nr:neutral/alkaline non-lysosomal ceramidase N-terminal domain-containing protein [Pirellulales bacterium]
MPLFRIVYWMILAVLVAMPASAAPPTWRAGVARVDITPPVPIWLSGYISRTKPATSVNDRLWAKALVLEDEHGTRVVLITMDLIGVTRKLSDTVCEQIGKQHHVPRRAIALSASHTHSGPVLRENLVPMFGLNAEEAKVVAEYNRNLEGLLVKVAREAFDTLQPARLTWGVGQATFAINRRNNNEKEITTQTDKDQLRGPVDHEVPVLHVATADGTTRAIVAGYACHATVLNGGSVSADWPGAAQAEMERRHAGSVAMFVAGCGGDQNPLPRRELELVKEYGSQFAEAVDRALGGSMRKLEPQLTATYEEIDLPFGELPTRADLMRDAAKGIDREKKCAQFLLAQWDGEGKLPQSYRYPIQAWKLGGDLTWLLLGGEVVVDYSLRLKQELGLGKTWVSSYSNDVMGYIPSRRVLAEGGYEGDISRYYYGLPAKWHPDVESHIVAKACELSSRAAQE